MLPQFVVLFVSLIAKASLLQARVCSGLLREVQPEVGPWCGTGAASVLRRPKDLHPPGLRG